jgi:hypothetical protein
MMTSRPDPESDIVRFAFEHRTNDGELIPNGVDPRQWLIFRSHDVPPPVSDLQFLHSRLPQFVARSGFGVRRETVADLKDGSSPWFYLLRPYAVPPLEKAFAGLSREVRQAIDAGRAYVLIDYTHEGYSNWMFFRVYEALRAVPLPPDRIVLLSGDLNAEEVHRRYLVRANISDPVHVHSLNYFKNDVAEYMTTPSYRRDHTTWLAAAGQRMRRAVFLNFNRRNRLHRVLAATLLNARGLLRYGLVSLPDRFEERDNQSAFEDEASRFGLSDRLLYEFRTNYQALRPQLPLLVDVDEMRTNHAFTHPTWPYLQTWFSLVSESLFFESAPGQVFISEKVWKPMMNFHPFLVIGDAGTLDALRRFGFRTFEPVINESYDRESCHEARLQLVLDEVARIVRLSEAQRYELFMELSPILRHNFDRLAADGYDDRFELWWRYIEKPRGGARLQGQMC